MGQCQTKIDNVLSPSQIPAGIRVVPINPPRRRLRRTRSKIILEIVNSTSKP